MQEWVADPVAILPLKKYSPIIIHARRIRIAADNPNSTKFNYPARAKFIIQLAFFKIVYKVIIIIIIIITACIEIQPYNNYYFKVYKQRLHN